MSLRPFMVVLFGVGVAFQATPGRADNNSSLPRFASLKVAEVDLQAGPGLHNAITRLYARQSLPVEVTADVFCRYQCLVARP